jgi:hypothetical protein
VKPFVVPVSGALKIALLINDDSRRDAAEAFIKNVYAARYACGWKRSSPASSPTDRFLNFLRTDRVVGETPTWPRTIAQLRKTSMFWNWAVIHRTLRCSLLMTVLAAAPACAEQSFDKVAGSWSGTGWMKPSDGARERVRCKVDYNVKTGGQSVKMNVRCASDAYKMDLSANIDQNGTALSGNWFESQYRQGGKVSGQNVDGLIEAKVESDTIIGLLTVRTKANHQTFVMEAPGAWVSQVSIDLARDAR